MRDMVELGRIERSFQILKEQDQDPLEKNNISSKK